MNLHPTGKAAGTLLLCVLPYLASAQDVPVQRNPIVTHATPVTTTQALRDMKEVPWHNVTKVMPEHRRYGKAHISNVPDSVAQSEILPNVGTTNLLNFDGIKDSQGGGFVPPDTNAAVGSTQVVETVNVAYAVYNKTTGAQIMAPKNIQTLYTPLGGQCATGNVSDPIATYDKAAQVWLITMIAFNNTFSQNNACVAISTTSDATGTYHLYSFDYKKTLPDYPKLGVWPDAYYLTTDSFPSGGFLQRRGDVRVGSNEHAAWQSRDVGVFPTDFERLCLNAGGSGWQHAPTGGCSEL